MRQNIEVQLAADRDVADGSMNAYGIADMTKNVTMKGIDAKAERLFHIPRHCVLKAPAGYKW